MTVLVVGKFENSPSRILERIRKSGRTVTYASTCEEAWSLLKSGVPVASIAIESKIPSSAKRRLLLKVSNDERYKKVPVYFLMKEEISVGLRDLFPS